MTACMIAFFHAGGSYFDFALPGAADAGPAFFAPGGFAPMADSFISLRPRALL
jgi:hypothetical protein